MFRRLVTVLGLTCALVGGWALPAAAQPLPDSMAALGNSITRGFNACGWYVDCPERSWSAGTDTAVNSHYLRLLDKNPGIEGNNYNLAESGATVADLASQAELAVQRSVDYVTVLVGANDACADTPAQMTPVSTFRDQLDEALETLKDGSPEAKLFIASIPDLKQLWEIGHTDPVAVSVWETGNICQSMLANPTSTAEEDVERRENVRQRIISYNQQLAQACADYGDNCRYDDGAVFGYDFTLDQVSGWDYFHPNTAGQKALAEVTYRAGFGW